MNPDLYEQWLYRALARFEEQNQQHRRGVPFDHRPSKGRSPQRHNEIVAQRAKNKAAKQARRKNRSAR